MCCTRIARIHTVELTLALRVNANEGLVDAEGNVESNVMLVTLGVGVCVVDVFSEGV